MKVGYIIQICRQSQLGKCHVEQMMVLYSTVGCKMIFIAIDNCQFLALWLCTVKKIHQLNEYI